LTRSFARAAEDFDHERGGRRGLFAVHDMVEELREIRRLIEDDDGEEEEEPEDEG
jgi:hypothetical protein